MADLKLTNVEKAYGEVKVLSNINLDIKRGELIVFVGPSGCGKSTLLRMIAGLERITGGTLEIDKQVVNDVPPAQRGIAMVFQSYALYPHMTVRDNMSFALKIAKKIGGRDFGGHRQSCTYSAADALSGPSAKGAVGWATPTCGHRPVHRSRPQGVSV